MEQTLLSVIIPVYNEAGTIATVLQRVLDVQLQDGIGKEIIIVDDASTDGTPGSIEAFARQHPGERFVFVRQPINQGKGAAIREGIRHAGGDWIIIQDADLEYNPDDYKTLLQPAIDGYADVVYGSRFAGGNPHRILFFWHSIGNKFLTLVSNVFTDLNLTDMETGYKLFRSDILKNIELHENRFGFEPEVTAKIARIPGIRIYEVGISYYGRTYEEGKKIKAVDGFRALYSIAKHNLQHTRPRRPLALFAAIFLVMIVLFKAYQVQPEQKDGIIHNDVAEYYQYLPAVFLYGDPGFGFTDTLSGQARKYFAITDYGAAHKTGRMTIGLSLLWTPGFLLAHTIALLTDDAANGYTLPYQLAISITSLIFLGLGLYFLMKLLFRYFPPLIVILSVTLITLATNLLYYTAYTPGMAHVYNFGLLAMLLYTTDNLYRSSGKAVMKRAAKAGLLLGMLSLIRPSNAIAIILVLGWGLWGIQSIKERVAFVRKNLTIWAIIMAGVLIVWLPQLIYWKWATGHFLFYTYGLKGEGFFFGNPQLSNVLLSYRNGLLVYSPVLIFALAGFIPLFRQKNENSPVLLLYFSILLYVLASWWCWWFGGSFGGRSFIDAYPVLAFPLAAFIRWAGSRQAWVRMGMVLVAALLIHLNYRQSYQAGKGYIHWEGMTRGAYWSALWHKRPAATHKYHFVQPNIQDALQGIYFKNDKPAFIKRNQQQFLEELMAGMKNNKSLMDTIAAKAKRRGISQDSMLRVDAAWIFRNQYKGKVPD